MVELFQGMVGKHDLMVSMHASRGSQKTKASTRTAQVADNTMSEHGRAGRSTK